MKCKTTNLLITLLCIALLLSLSACGGETAPLASEQVEADVQEYLVSFVDENATLTSLSQVSNPISDTEQKITCPFSYDINGKAGSGTIVLTYAFENGEWVLESYDDEAVAKPFDLGGETVEDAVNGYANTADEVAGMFAGIQADIDVDTTDIENFGNQTHEYPDSVNGVSTMEDIADIYRFTLDGKAYSMPCSLKELLDDGWEPGLTNASTDTLDGRTYSVYVLYKGDASVSVSVANFEESPATVEKGTLIEITATSDGKADFQTGKGLKIGDDSSRVTQLYGSETYSASDNVVEYSYLRQLGFQENISGIMREYTLEDNFHIQWDSSGKVNYIQMKYLNE